MEQGHLNDVGHTMNSWSAPVGNMQNRQEKLPESQKFYTIGELSREYGVTLRALRFYEDRHLLNPRREGLMRLYSQNDKERLDLLLLGKRIGMSIIEISEILDLFAKAEAPDESAQIYRGIHERFVRQMERLEVRKTEIFAAIDELGRHIEMVSGRMAPDLA